jgi:hypothetical protein
VRHADDLSAVGAEIHVTLTEYSSEQLHPKGPQLCRAVWADRLNIFAVFQLHHRLFPYPIVTLSSGFSIVNIRSSPAIIQTIQRKEEKSLWILLISRSGRLFLLFTYKDDIHPTGNRVTRDT